MKDGEGEREKEREKTKLVHNYKEFSLAREIKSKLLFKHADIFTLAGLTSDRKCNLSHKETNRGKPKNVCSSHALV